MAYKLKEDQKAYSKKWRELNRARIREQSHIYYLTTKKARNDYNNSYYRQHRQEKIDYVRLNQEIKFRNRINRLHNQKYGSGITKISCRICDSTEHLTHHHHVYEKQWNGMILCRQCHADVHKLGLTPICRR